jgi:GNAT superfamily N-acetyltransferase
VVKTGPAAGGSILTRIKISEWDTVHFGIQVYKTEIESASQENVIPDFRHQDGIGLLICRCNTSYVSQIHALEKSGFELMGTLVKYSAEIDKLPNTRSNQTGTLVRSFQKDDISFIADIAGNSFKGYSDHFHSDPRLDPEKCDDLYREWAVNSCSDKNLADKVIVAELSDNVAGFVTIKRKNADTGDFVLAGVREDTRGKGIYQRLIAAGIDWCRENGLNRVESSTQINNYTVQKVWSHLGLRMDASVYIFHKWFDGMK